MRATKNKRTGRYQFRFRDSAGNQQQFTSKQDFPSGITEKSADLKATEIYALHEKEINKTRVLTIKECVKRMLKHLESSGLKGIENYESHAKKALEYDDNCTINEIVNVSNYMCDCMLEAKKPDGTRKYSNNTIYQRMNIFKRTAKLAYERWGIIKYPVSAKIKTPKKPRARDKFLDVNQCFNLIQNCTDEQVRYILEFYALTGIRHAELKRMKRSDFKANRIKIDGKNGRMRSFAVSQSAVLAAEKIEWPVKIPYWKIWNEFSDAKDRAGIEDFNMHDLRHTFASWLIQSGDVSLHELQHLMGHSNPNQTDQYAHLLPDHLDGLATHLKVVGD